MLGHPQLPPGLIEHCMNVLKKIMPSERDLIRVIVEIIVDLREGEDDAENADDPQTLVGSYYNFRSVTKPLIDFSFS